MDYSKRTIRQTVDTDGGAYGEFVSDWLKSLQQKIDSVPENFRDQLRIEIEAEDYYGALSARVELFYYREPNAAEIAAAKARDMQAQDYERRQYEALKKKFGE